mmetsp:Transcript_53040/g.152855  ORF Transcript_53040/g.152855 Transcript_53040/m.152855 type:complete len:230 (+) Transcript_53040:260-949(+)
MATIHTRLTTDTCSSCIPHSPVATATKLVVHQNRVQREAVIQVNLPNHEALLLNSALATEASAPANHPIVVWVGADCGRVVSVVPVTAEVSNVPSRVVGQALDEVGLASEVVRGVVGKHHHRLRLAFVEALPEQLHGFCASLVQVLLASLLALGVATTRRASRRHVLVQVQAHHLKIELGVLYMVVRARHVEELSVCRVVVHLRTLCVFTACTLINVVIVIAVDAVPRY